MVTIFYLYLSWNITRIDQRDHEKSKNVQDLLTVKHQQEIVDLLL